jgi:hypothetical protein
VSEKKKFLEEEMIRQTTRRECPEHLRLAREFMEEWRRLKFLFVEGVEAAGQDFPAALHDLLTFCHKWEGQIPEPCGECPACYKRENGCEHGWSEKRLCRDCNGTAL